MSNQAIKIEGSEIRRQLRAKNLPGGFERICCGGRKTFSRDYRTQIKTLNLHGKFKVTENGAVMDELEV